MGRFVGNGLIELVDEKSSDRGFFCMKLVGDIGEESKEQLTLDYQDLWELCFSEARRVVAPTAIPAPSTPGLWRSAGSNQYN